MQENISTSEIKRGESVTVLFRFYDEALRKIDETSLKDILFYEKLKEVY